MGNEQLKYISEMKRRIIVSTSLIYLITSVLLAGPVKVKKTFPDVGDYKVLKCDFHMHTVFSDGNVWPNERIIEAYSEDIDAISITDHLEYRPKKDQLVDVDFNNPYKLAESASKQYEVINILGAEITRETPPGHLNAIFLKNANELFNPSHNENPGSRDGFEIAVKRAYKQGGFVFYNHPYYLYNHDAVTLPESVRNLMAKGYIKGIELVNENRYIPQSFGWAKEMNLALIASTDVHTGMGTFLQEFDLDHRPITLVLAEKKSQDGILHALNAGRTIVWYGDLILGFEENVLPLVEEYIQMEHSFNKGKLNIKFSNDSPLTFKIEFLSNNDLYVSQSIVLRPNTETIMSLNIKKPDAQVVEGSFRINNVWIGNQQPLIIKKKFAR